MRVMKVMRVIKGAEADEGDEGDDLRALLPGQLAEHEGDGCGGACLARLRQYLRVRCRKCLTDGRL